MSGTGAAVAVWAINQVGIITLPGQGAAFVAAGAAFAVDVLVSVLVSMATSPKPVAELAGLVYSETPRQLRTDTAGGRLPWYQSPTRLAAISLILVVALNLIFH